MLATGGGVRAAPPDIVVISIDMLRPDHLGCAGYDRATSPRIDELAAAGARFEQAVSSTSSTRPAHAALFTGLVDAVHGCAGPDERLAAGRRTLAERLRAHGYATAGFVSHRALHPDSGLARGFDTYVDGSAGPRDLTSPRLATEAIAWLRAPRTTPRFVFVHLGDVRPDHAPPPPFDTMFDPDYDGPIDGVRPHENPLIHLGMDRRDLDHLVALYDGEIAWTDEHVGRIVDAIDAGGGRDRTIIVLLAAHGVEFLEHGDVGHGRTLYDEVVRIPLIVRFPRHVPANRAYRAQARLIDVVPTVLDLAGLPAPDDVMGQSLAPIFADGALRDDTLAICEVEAADGRLRAYRRPDRKLIEREGSTFVEMYRLGEDPDESIPHDDPGSALAWVQGLVRDRAAARAWIEAARGP